MTKLYDPTITVCSKCLRACCWQGEFMCDESQTASTVTRKVSTLVRRDYGEHPDYWNVDLDTSHRALLTVAELKAHGLSGNALALSEVSR